MSCSRSRSRIWPWPTRRLPRAPVCEWPAPSFRWSLWCCGRNISGRRGGFRAARLRGHDLVPFQHESLDRQPFRGRRSDQRTSRAAAHGHVQGPRDRRRGQGEDSTSVRSALSFSFSRTPNRCSSSITTRPRSLNRVFPCSNRCVAMTMSTVPASRPAARAPSASLLLRKRDRALDADRPVGEAVDEGGVVLLREQGGGHQDGDLFAGLHGDEGGAQRDFGFAEARRRRKSRDPWACRTSYR